jgi:hypothetical protein
VSSTRDPIAAAEAIPVSDPRAEIGRLGRELRVLARQERFARFRLRYRLRVEPPVPLSPYRRLRVGLGWLLRWLGVRNEPAPPWLAALKSSSRSDDAQPLVIWAIGAERDMLRRACLRFDELLADLPEHAPVLVTDVADFAFYSRLGWLVEYVPAFAPPAEGYARRKQQYLAWRYHDAAAVPIDIALDPGFSPELLKETLNE